MDELISNMSDTLENSTNTILTVLVSVVMICSALIPIVLGQIANLEDMADKGLIGDVSKYVPIIEVVLILCIVGLLIMIVRGYSRGREYD